jgi:hypothetical protein
MTEMKYTISYCVCENFCDTILKQLLLITVRNVITVPVPTF